MQHLLAASRTTGPVLPFPYEIASHHAHVENKVKEVSRVLRCCHLIQLGKWGIRWKSQLGKLRWPDGCCKLPFQEEGNSARIGKGEELEIKLCHLGFSTRWRGYWKAPWFAAHRLHPGTNCKCGLHFFYKGGKPASDARPRDIIALRKEWRKILWEINFLLTGTTSSCMLTWFLFLLVIHL